MARDLSKIADRLQACLVERGFVVHRYDAITSRSVYLKLDYGACGSIRISDHEGYRHLKYMWNIGTWICKERHGAGRNYYPCTLADRMVEAICALRESRIEANDYERRIESGKRYKSAARSGFWAHPETYEVGKAVS